MKLSLVFDNTGDELPFTVLHNHELINFFVDHANKVRQNSFCNHRALYREVEPKITHLHWALSKTNEVLYDLIAQSFAQQTNLVEYLDQRFLNAAHCSWVWSQQSEVNIDQLRHSSDKNKAKLGSILHELYPDDIRSVPVAAVLEKLGYIFSYEEVNMAVHRLESSFNQSTLEFKADQKWNVFDNPYKSTMTSNNDVVNFAFGYTYVGRQYHDKFVNFDTDLEFDDHYNYEKLEFAFQLNLAKPQTIPFSQEFLSWTQQKQIQPITTQIPIANLVNIEKNLFDYRKILYKNSKDNNWAKLILI
jgi:hypothetical protein